MIFLLLFSIPARFIQLPPLPVQEGLGRLARRQNSESGGAELHDGPHVGGRSIAPRRRVHQPLRGRRQRGRRLRRLNLKDGLRGRPGMKLIHFCLFRASI